MGAKRKQIKKKKEVSVIIKISPATRELIFNSPKKIELEIHKEMPYLSLGEPAIPLQKKEQ